MACSQSIAASAPGPGCQCPATPSGQGLDSGPRRPGSPHGQNPMVRRLDHWRSPGIEPRSKRSRLRAGRRGATCEHRQLKRGAAGWVLLAGLGVAYVISGDFAGWNFGLAEGGWGGLLIATILMATMYTCMVFGLAELASAIPVAGAGYGFARRALGPLGGFATGIAILIEYAIAPAAIAVFIGGYVEALGLFGLTSSWPVYLACYVIFVGIHLCGVGEALRVMFVITARRRGRAGRVRGRDDAEVRRRQAVRHRPDRRAAGASDFIPFGVRRGAGGARLRDLVLPRGRGRAAGRRGGTGPAQGHAPRHHHRDGGAAGLRGADAGLHRRRRRHRR